MHDNTQRFRFLIGSLFSGYGDLDLVVEHAFNVQIVWFSEINQPVVGVSSPATGSTLRTWATSAPSIGTP
jgi:DNA (cytosine-5)-methyltransferase 1